MTSPSPDHAARAVLRRVVVHAAAILPLLTLPTALRAQGGATQPVTLRFSASVDSLPFACGTTYPGIGRTRAPITATDFRFFVHDVRLVDATGREVPVTLQQDSLWQSHGVALLDFENGSGGCSNGHAELRDVVLGSAPAGRYTGVRFTVGVPFDLNHRDLTQQPSPLSLSRMFWAWNSGYKFMRIDMKTDGGKAWVLHLGSTECQPAGAASTVPTSCQHANRPQVAFDAFDVAQDVVNLDLAAMLRGADVTVNQPRTAMGCMSGPTDSDCAPVFASLGLPFGAAAATPQTAFRVRRDGRAAGDVSSQR